MQTFSKFFESFLIEKSNKLPNVVERMISLIEWIKKEHKKGNTKAVDELTQALENFNNPIRVSKHMVRAKALSKDKFEFKEKNLR